MKGLQEPRVLTFPSYVSSAGQEAVELAQMAGLGLDAWQQLALAHSLGERADGSWAAFEVGICAPRQNGKNAITEARELAGLFLLGERMIIHSAHEFKTSLEAFRRLLELVEGTPEFSRRVKRVSRSHGEEGIELIGGQRIYYRTRTSGGGRGLGGDCLILDEAMILPEAALGALFPTLSARPNPQVYYTGSAVDQEIHEHGNAFARVRERGLAGDDPALAYFEWSPDLTLAQILKEPGLATDPAVWATANPGMGIRITSEYISREIRSLSLRTFAVERLGVGDWPSTDSDDAGVIDRETWAALADHRSGPAGPVCFAYDVRPNRAASAIAAAGLRTDGKIHIEIIDHRDGTGWLASRIVELEQEHANVGVVGDERGPAGAMGPDLTQAHVAPRLVNGGEYAQACGMFYDAVNQAALVHLGTTELAEAVRGAAQRPLGDAWAWSRRTSTADISPLVAATLALWGLRTMTKSVYETRDMLILE